MANRSDNVSEALLADMPQYMVVERFHSGAIDQIYQRFNQHGRLLPDGLHYIDSWLSKDANICFQIMATDNKALFTKWIAEWSDLTDFDIYPIDKKPA